MWKTHEPQPAIPPSTSPTASTTSLPRTSDIAHIGKSVVIKGELAGDEDLFLDGEVEGSIAVREHVLIVGPNGRIRARVQARNVVVQGKIEGDISAERVELKSSANVLGDIVTQRIVMEDGAYLKGSVDVHKEVARETAKPEPLRETRMPQAAPQPEFAQAGLAEHKK